jgi:crotonobetainyl-CoA:carnitine CoA-transferase CaiB-like acyl-CoA transferase
MPSESVPLGPLDGIRVVDVTTAILGPLATQILGDLGADVVKVEPPAGDPMRNLGPSRNPGMAAMFLGFNRNKRSVVLDLKQHEDQQRLLDLVARADVFLHNMRPSAARKLGISYRHVEALNKRLVYASASGYGRDHARAEEPAYDEIIQGGSGIAGLFEQARERATFAPFVIADKVAGYVLASSVSAALVARDRLGHGQEVHVPMLESLVEFNLHEHFWGRAFEPALGAPGYSRIFVPERRPFATADGSICVTATTDAQWARLFTAVGRPDLAEDARFSTMAQRSRHFGEAFRLLAAEMTKRSSAEWTAIFNAADLPYGPAASLDGLFDDEHLHAAGFFRSYEHPSEGTLITTNPPVRFSATPAGFRRPPPQLGEHTREVLAEWGVA